MRRRPPPLQTALPALRPAHLSTAILGTGAGTWSTAPNLNRSSRAAETARGGGVSSQESSSTLDAPHTATSSTSPEPRGQGQGKSTFHTRSQKRNVSALCIPAKSARRTSGSISARWLAPPPPSLQSL
eukprot:1282191-Rhodomonas_salina.1